MKTKIKLILWIIISGIISQTNAQNLELVHEVSTPYKIAVSAVDTGFVVGAFNVSNQFYQFIDPVSGEIISTEIPYLLSGIIHQQNLVSTTYGDAYKLKEYVNNDWQDIVYINDIDDAGRIENQYFIVESQELLVYNNDSESFIDTVELDGFDSYISQLCVNNSGVFIGSKNSSANIFRLYDIQNQNIESLPDLPFVGGKSTAVKDMEFVDSTLYIVVSSGSYGGLHGSAVYKLNGEIWEQVYHYESDDTYNYATDFAAVKLENGEIYFAITTHDSRTFILRKPPENNPPIIETELLTAFDIEKLNVRGSHVTLSACETGLGQFFRTEGMTGIRHSFFLAGANSIISSLWDVSDPVSNFMMQMFYKLIENENYSYTDALSEIKRRIIINQLQIRGYSDVNLIHPKYWSCFVGYGV